MTPLRRHLPLLVSHAVLFALFLPVAASAQTTSAARLDILGWQEYGTTNVLADRQPSHTFSDSLGNSVTFQVPPTVPGVVDPRSDVIRLAQTLTVTGTITASLSYSSPTISPMVLSMELQAIDSWDGSSACKKAAAPIHVPAGITKASYSATMTCDFTALHVYNASYDTRRASVDMVAAIRLQLEDGTLVNSSSWVNLAVHYYERYQQDIVGLVVPSPDPRAPLSVRPVLSFSGSVSKFLGTVDAAVVTVYVIDQDGKTAGTSAPIPFKLNDTPLKPFSIPNVRLPQKPGRVQLFAQMADASLTKELATASATYDAVQGCDLGGTIQQVVDHRDTGINPVPDARVELLDAAGATKAVTHARLAGTSSAPQSTYCFLLPQPLDTHQKYTLRVTLGSLWPSRLATMCTGTPSRSRMVACVCRSSWSTRGGRPSSRSVMAAKALVT